MLFIKKHPEITPFHQHITYFLWILIYFHLFSLDFVGFRQILTYFRQILSKNRKHELLSTFIAKLQQQVENNKNDQNLILIK